MSERPVGVASLGLVGRLTEQPQQQVLCTEGPSEAEQWDPAVDLTWGSRGLAWKRSPHCGGGSLPGVGWLLLTIRYLLI